MEIAALMSWLNVANLTSQVLFKARTDANLGEIAKNYQRIIQQMHCYLLLETQVSFYGQI